MKETLGKLTIWENFRLRIDIHREQIMMLFYRLAGLFSERARNAHKKKIKTLKKYGRILKSENEPKLISCASLTHWDNKLPGEDNTTYDIITYYEGPRLFSLMIALIVYWFVLIQYVPMLPGMWFPTLCCFLSYTIGISGVIIQDRAKDWWGDRAIIKERLREWLKRE